jgi:hypothetical protein
MAALWRGELSSPAAASYSRLVIEIRSLVPAMDNPAAQDFTKMICAWLVEANSGPLRRFQRVPAFGA